jgi:hypothetical protein
MTFVDQFDTYTEAEFLKMSTKATMSANPRVTFVFCMPGTFREWCFENGFTTVTADGTARKDGARAIRIEDFDEVFRKIRGVTAHEIVYHRIAPDKVSAQIRECALSRLREYVANA